MPAEHSQGRYLLKRFGWIYPFLLYAAFTLILFSGSGIARAQETSALPETATIQLSPEEQAWLAAHPDIRLGYIDTAEPEVIANPDGSYSGILIDFLAALNRRLGTRIGLEIDTIPGILEKAKTKKVDGILEMHPVYADKLGLLKTAAYLTSYPAVFGYRSVSFRGPSDFAGKTVAISDKIYFSEKIARQYAGQATILKVSNALEGLRRISLGDADFFISQSFSSYLFEKYQLFDFATKYTFFDLPSGFGMAIRPDWPELVPILNKGISSFKKYELDAFVAKWVHSPQPKERIALTPEEQAWLAQNHTVRVRVGNFPPEIIIGKDEITGIAIDYLNLIAQRSGVTFEFVHETRPLQKAFESLMNLQGPDLITSLSPIAERKIYMNFSVPYIVSPRMIFTRIDGEFISGIDQLKGRILAVPKGTLMHKRLEMEYPEIDLMLYDTDLESIEAVSTGKADAYIGNLINASYEILHRGFANLKIATLSPFGDAVHTFGIRKDWPELNSIIHKALESISIEEAAAIRAKHFKLQYEYGINPTDVLKWSLIAIGGGFGIVFFFVYWNRSLSKKVKERTSTLAETEERFRTLVEQSPLSIQLFDNDGKIAQINAAWMKLWGISEELLPDVLDKYNILEDEEAKKLGVMPLIEKAFKEGETVVLPVIEYDVGATMDHLSLDSVTGNKRWIQARLYPVRNSKGEIVNIVDIEEDITERMRAEKELLQLKDQLHEENIYLREEIQVEHNFNEIIGNSAALRYILFRVEQIASVNTTVLLLGETGTGKELIAHAIHNTSSRKERPLIKVNCATLPAHLIESELFGHEKGAFTGATVQRIGRFELADGATLFLDEIGEMPLELQSKLLRVLQDGEFERVGSSRTIKVDVRLIAATNRDLETEIQSGRFRQDLFYRLNVYSLTLPPLRERPEDIPLLVDAFIKKNNKKLGKRIELISQKTTDDLMAYSWPGNIRELQNVIEHAVILAQDKTLRVELPETQKSTSAQEPTQTLDEMERDYIQEVLNLKKWRIDGPEGAALVLDLKPSTLRSRMQKLGIKRPS